MMLHENTNPAGAAPLDPLAWRDDSLCRTHPTQWWFAGTTHEVVQAKRICGGCTVADQCLEFALARPELLGIWGATTPSERAGIRRARRAGRDERPTRPSGAHAGVPPAPAWPRHEGPVVGVRPDPVPAPVVAPAAPFGAEREVSPALPAAGPALSAAAVGGAASDTEELLTPAEAARLLGVTPNTVTRWSRAGRIAAIRTMGGHRRFRRADIDRALQTAVAESDATFG